MLSPLGFLGELSAKKKVIAAFSVLFLLSTVFYNPFNDVLYKREEIKPLLKAVQREIEPGDRVFVFTGAHLTWRHYTKTLFKPLGAIWEDTFVCPYNAAPEACVREIEPFCNLALNRGNSCYILYSSEVNTLRNLRLLENSATKLDAKIIQKDKNSMLYKASGL